MEEPSKLPTGDPPLLDTHFLGTRIKKRPEMVDLSGRIRAKSEDWKKAKLVVTEDKISWAVYIFVP